MGINFNRVVWEGWTVQSFIDDLDLMVRIKVRQGEVTTPAQMKSFCKDNQPYYKKPIPEVYKYFTEKYLTGE